MVVEEKWDEWFTRIARFEIILSANLKAHFICAENIIIFNNCVINCFVFV